MNIGIRLCEIYANQAVKLKAGLVNYRIRSLHQVFCGSRFYNSIQQYFYNSVKYNVFDAKVAEEKNF